MHPTPDTALTGAPNGSWSRALRVSSPVDLERPCHEQLDQGPKDLLTVAVLFEHLFQWVFELSSGCPRPDQRDPNPLLLQIGPEGGVSRCARLGTCAFEVGVDVG